MNRITFLALTFFILAAGAAQSQAPAANNFVSSLQAIIATNKALLDSEQKTLDGLDQLDQNAAQLKDFGKRG